MMEYQIIYSEAMAKLAEAQKCQSDIVGYVNELKDVNEAKAEISTMYNLSKTRLYLSSRQIALNEQINSSIRERNSKLNETLSEALDLIKKEEDDGISVFNSLGLQVYNKILSYTKWYDIQWQPSIDVVAKEAMLVHRGIKFFNQQMTYGNP